mmetsp:Transcript_39785/g.29354  ORF Transcript_39785/g.29354 Transcript_39785/m.29354 type:complete len:88 (+) Transcript_39785:457-720(+)
MLRLGLKMSCKIIREINHFKQEHKIFQNQFVFRSLEYREMLLLEAKEILDFMQDIGLQVPILKENGLLIERDDDHATYDIGNYQLKQ